MADVDPDVVRELRRLLSRRSVLRGAAGAGLLAAGGSLLAACQSHNTPQSAAAAAPPAHDLSAVDKVVNFSNWPLYIDAKGKGHPTLDAFTARTGIKVNYLEDINDNDQYFAGQIRPKLSAGRDMGRDLFVLTDWMAARLIELKWVQKLDITNLPNARNIEPSLLEVPFDTNRLKEPYSMPWAGIMAGIAYNSKVTKKVSSIAELFSRPDLHGKVTALTEMRDTVGLTLLDLGQDPETVDDPQFEEALATIDGAVKSGQIRRFTGNDYTQDLASGNIAACIAWSGDIVQLQADNPYIRFVTPDLGGTRSNDNLMVPIQAQHKTNAEKLINYYYDPKVAAKLAAYVNYICPVKGAQAELAKTDPKTANNPLIFPSEELLSKLHSFKALDEATEKTYNAKFQKVIGPS